MSRARSLANRASDFTSAKDSGPVSGSTPYSVVITGNSTGSAYLSCNTGTDSEVRLTSYGVSASGTTAGVLNTSLGVLDFGDPSGYIMPYNSGMIKADNSIYFSTGGTVKFELTYGGNLLGKSKSGGIGYGEGAGGTITQNTNKATTVTLAAYSGRIVTSNAALAANTSVTFTFNNACIGLDDVIVVNNSNVSNNYQINVAYVFNGGAAIRITNISAGSLSEALTLKFAVIKGSQA